MRNLVIAIVALLVVATIAWAADTKLSALTELDATPAGSDELYISDDGTSKKITVTNLLGSISDTDDQTIDVSELDGTTLKISLEGDSEATKEIDLSSLQDDVPESGDFGAAGDLESDGTISANAVTYAETAGSYKSATPTVDDPDNWTMSGVGMYGGIWIANAAGTGGLPAVAAGMKFNVLVEGANTVVLNPNAADTIYLDGAAETQDENITTDGTSGAILVCFYRSANAWACLSDGHWDGATD